MPKGILLCSLGSLFVLSLLGEPQQGERGIGPSTSQAVLRRTALVVGNANYGPDHSLKNPPNDARKVAASLRDLQFDVDEVVDGSWATMGLAVDRFVSKLGPGSAGLFYYSGHGLEIDGVNYLISTYFKGGEPVAAKFKSISANEIQERMEKSHSNLNILILDACRDSPVLSGSRGLEGGWAEMSGVRVPGTVIVFATAPKQTASDNPAEENGLFTKYLLQGLKRPDLEMRALFDYVGKGVYAESGGKQIPYINSTPLDPFYFHPGGTSRADATGGRLLPRLEGLKADRVEVTRGVSVHLTAHVTHPDGSKLQYQWSSSAGNIEGHDESALLRTDSATPKTVGDTVLVTVKVADESGAAVSEALEIRILQPRPSLDFAADHLQVRPGDPVKLRWTVTDSSSVRLEPGVGDVPAGGERTISPTKTLEYTLSAIGPGGSASKGLTILVAPRIVALEGLPATIRRCEDTLIRWTVEGASSARIEPGVGNINPTSGYRILRPLSNTVYTLIAEGAGGKAVQRLEITVKPTAAPSCDGK